MTKIKFDLANYEPVPEGERILEITKAECKPSGKPTALHVTFKDLQTNSTILNRYDFNSNGGLTAMAIMCRIALDLPNAGEFDTISDTPKLIGKKLVCEVVHNQGSQPREDGTFPVFANIKKVISRADDVATISTTVTDTTVSPRQAIIGNDLD